MTDIIDRLRGYAKVSEMTGAYTEANCAYDAIEEIERLRTFNQELIVAFRVNMMRHCSEYSHEEFDKKIDEIRK
jgi:GTP cyclohydrolase III